MTIDQKQIHGSRSIYALKGMRGIPDLYSHTGKIKPRLPRKWFVRFRNYSFTHTQNYVRPSIKPASTTTHCPVILQSGSRSQTMALAICSGVQTVPSTALSSNWVFTRS